MLLADITVLVLTCNEEANIGRTLAAVGWARQVVIVDSGSSDRTREIATGWPTVRWVERPFDCHAQQWNAGLSLVETEWTLALDADYVCAPELPAEIARLPTDHVGFEAVFSYFVAGRPIRRSLYPPHVVLFRTGAARFVQDGHTQRLLIGAGPIARLQSPIAHDDRKPRSLWLESQRKYAALEAVRILQTSPSKLSWRDRLRQVAGLSALATFIYCLFVRGLLLDGRRGLTYALERTYAELLLSLELEDRRLRQLAGHRGSDT